MEKVSYFKSKGELTVAIQGFTTQRVIEGLKKRGFRFDNLSKTWTARYSDEAESYIEYLDKICKEKAAAMSILKPKRKTYFELFIEGKTVEEIANNNETSVNNVYEQLVKKAIIGEIHYQDLMDDDSYQMIKKYILNYGHFQGIKELKESAPFNVEYWELKLVLGTM